MNRIHIRNQGLTARDPRIAAILREVSCEFRTSIRTLKSPKKLRPVSDAREVCMFFITGLVRINYGETGRIFEGRCHTTVGRACRAVQNRLDTEPAFARQLSSLRSRLALIVTVLENSHHSPQPPTLNRFETPVLFPLFSVC